MSRRTLAPTLRSVSLVVAAITIAGLAMASGPGGDEPKPEAAPTPPPEGAVTILYTLHNVGYIEPCG